MMMPNDSPSIDDLQDLDTRSFQLETRVLRQLLDKQREKANHLLAVKAKMGGARSFITSASLQWVAKQIRYASELPIFENYTDPDTKSVRINSQTVLLQQQRELDWTRQFDMTLYLVREFHKFPALLVVSYENWVDKENADEWVNSKATKDSIDASALDSEGQYFDLALKDSTMLYAIDGQHRLMAIQGLHELLTQTKLYAYNKQKKAKKEFISREDILERSHIQKSDLQDMMSERIGIEIMPAVLQGDTKEQALQRLQTVFVDINRTAKRPTAGEIYLLDANDGYAVVARSALTKHKLLKDRVGLKGKQLADTSDDYTTFETLVHISGQYLQPHYHWPLIAKEMIRPEDKELDQAYKKLEAYLDALSSLPSHKELVNGKGAAEIRTKQGDDHILFRPVAQIALAEAIGSLEAEDEDCTLEKMFEILAKKDKEGAFRMTDPHNSWYGTICDIGEFQGKGKVKMVVKEENRKLCSNLFRHLIGRGTKDDNTRKELKKLFTKARSIDAEKGIAIDLNGNPVPYEKIELPSPWPW